MRAQEQDVLARVRDWLSAGKRIWLCTIVGTVGSSPRPVGAMLACNDAGEQVGSLSGGCVEDDLLERIRGGDISLTLPQQIEYGVTAQENERLGLPCGGRLYVLVEPLLAVDSSVKWVDEVLAQLSARRCIVRTLHLNSGDVECAACEQYVALKLEPDRLVQCFGPQMRLVLVGAGQLSLTVAELALAMDYEVMVTDPRQALLDQWEGPAVPLLSGMPDDVVREFADDPHSIVITLTHDPRIDDMALMEALERDCWYVGALGSQRTTTKRVSRLRTLGLDDAALQRLHAPVGLPIGSKTPMEIAIAILGELTQLRRAAETRT
ncbi:MAG: XdhC family protein [Halioglobus sp.]